MLKSRILSLSDADKFSHRPLDQEFFLENYTYLLLEIMAEAGVVFDLSKIETWKKDIKLILEDFANSIPNIDKEEKA